MFTSSDRLLGFGQFCLEGLSDIPLVRHAVSTQVQAWANLLIYKFKYQTYRRISEMIPIDYKFQKF